MKAIANYDPGAEPRPTSRSVRLWNAPELMATVFPEPIWLIPGIIISGLTLLVATPKFGKSWFVLSSAIAAAGGGKALGRIQVEPCDVLYLALEDTPRRLQSRLRMLLGGAAPPLRLTITTDWPEDGMGMVRDWLDTHPDAGAVIVDVLARTRPPALTGETSYTADYRAVSAWKEIADTYDVGVILVHHTRKQADEDFLSTVSGTQGIAGAADSVIVMARARNSADAEMHVTGRDVPEAKYALRFDANTGSWLLLDDPPEVLGMGDTRRRILKLLEVDGPHTPKQIAVALGIREENARQTCKRMFDASQIDTAEGVYSYLSPLSPESLTTVPSDRSDSSDTPLGGVADVA